MKRVIVASKNPTKVNAARDGFALMFPDEEFTIEGVSAPSGVSDQPMDCEETFLGATNRVEHIAKEFPDADYWIGIEGGMENKYDDMHIFAWIVAKSRDKVGTARTGTFLTPPKIKKMINEGIELGDASATVFNYPDSKRKNGAVGILTDDVIDRTKYYADALVLALIPLKNPDFY